VSQQTAGDWELFQCFDGLGAAEALCARLLAENVPAQIEPHTLGAGLPGQYCVFVYRTLVHRARWIVSQMPPTDAELEFLATGKLSDSEDKR
jgi:hypothetical protein